MALQKKQTYQPPASGSKPAQPKKAAEQQEEYNEQIADPSDAAWKAIAEGKEFSAPDPNTYEAIVNEVKMMPMNDKGVSVRAEFVLVMFDQEGELRGERFSRLFKILEADGRTPSKALQFFSTFMAKLGYERTNRGPDAFEEITEDKPAISLKIQENANPQYPPNATVIMRLSDDNENIQGLREWMANNPW